MEILVDELGIYHVCMYIHVHVCVCSHYNTLLGTSVRDIQCMG